MVYGIRCEALSYAAVYRNMIILTVIYGDLRMKAYYIQRIVGMHKKSKGYANFIDHVDVHNKEMIKRWNIFP